MALRIGYKASAEQFGPTELVDLAVAAEAAGLDSAFASDISSPGETRADTRRMP